MMHCKLHCNYSLCNVHLKTCCYNKSKDRELEGIKDENIVLAISKEIAITKAYMTQFAYSRETILRISKCDLLITVNMILAACLPSC